MIIGVVLAGIFDLVGRMHPLVVHLPIGILLLAVLLHVLSRRKRFQSFTAVLPVVYALGLVSAALACLSGFVLRWHGSYEEPLMSRHLYAGVAVLVFSLLNAVLQWQHRFSEVWRLRTGLLLIPAVVLAGHWGGSLTPGEDYLSGAFQSEKETRPALPAIANINEAMVYEDMVAPLLAKRCYNCHGDKKQKGDLRLNDFSLLLKGGEHGEAIKPGEPSASLMMTRLQLPRDHEEHMPPRQQPQLTADEIVLIHWWIANGASTTARVKEWQQSENDKAMLQAFATGQHRVTAMTGVALRLPPQDEAPADEKLIAQLRKDGVVVLPVGAGKPWLSVTINDVQTNLDTAFNRMRGIAKNIVWLNVSGMGIKDSMLLPVKNMSNLTRLNISGTRISDNGLAHLKGLSQLAYLNLYKTGISSKGLQALGDMPMLRQLFVYQTAVQPAEISSLQNQWPKCSIDTGNYKVPWLVQDTVVLKATK